MTHGRHPLAAEPPRDAGPGPRSSRMELELAPDRSGVTRPIRCLAQPPVQLSRVRYDTPGAPETAALTLLHLGGVLQGDRVEMRVSLAAGAAARVQMAAATQVLRMPAGDAAHALDIRLAAGSRLAWLAEPLILFGGARFRQSTSLALGDGARLALLDVLCPGRLARGELLAFERFESRLEIHDDAGRLLAAERALVEPACHRYGTPGALGDTPVAGSLFLLGGGDHERLAERLHSEADGAMGVTTLPGDCGVLVRALGCTPSDVRRRLLERLALAAAGGW